MKRDDIIAGLRELLRSHKQLKLPLAAITEETVLRELGFDSLTILDFLYDIETRFGVLVEIPDLVEMRQVRELLDYLEARIPR